MAPKADCAKSRFLAGTRNHCVAGTASKKQTSIFWLASALDRHGRLRVRRASWPGWSCGCLEIHLEVLGDDPGHDDCPRGPACGCTACGSGRSRPALARELRPARVGLPTPTAWIKPDAAPSVKDFPTRHVARGAGPPSGRPETIRRGRRFWHPWRPRLVGVWNFAISAEG